MPPKIIATADTHGSLPPIPPCDILIIAGDVCPIWDHSLREQFRYLNTEFRSWLNRVPAGIILGIAGNHDFVFEKWSAPVEALNLPWYYLQDEAFTAFGVKFWGSPWVPNLSRWAFHDADEGIDAKLAAIPEDVDVVVSHGPPHGHLDFTCPRFGSQNAGFPGLNDTLERVKPAALVCGHIHEGYGAAEHPSGAVVYNVSHMTETYAPINAPRTVHLDGYVPLTLPAGAY